MRVLVVEDDKRIGDFVARGLTEAGFAVDRAADGVEALHMATTESYDAIVLDLMLPKLDGLSVLESLRQRQVNTPVLILSAKRTVDDRVTGLQAGGDDYLVKPFSFTELLARVQALIRRASGTTEAARLVVSDLVLDLLKHQAHRGEKPVDLTPKEFTLLEYLVRNEGRVVSKTMIMEHVWGYSFDPRTNVVESQICRLRDKIDGGKRQPLIHTVRGVGYVVKAEE